MFVSFANSLSAAASMRAMPLMGINGYGTCYHSLEKVEAACALEVVGDRTVSEDKNCEK